MEIFSTGDVAKLLGIHRDKVQSELLAGAPKPSMLLGKGERKRKAFTVKDVQKFHEWCQTRGIAVTTPNFSAMEVNA